MGELNELRIKGKLLTFINNFLTKSRFKTLIGNVLSDPKEQETAVVQGSILSMILFNAKINNIIKCINFGLKCLLNEDDFFVYY